MLGVQHSVIAICGHKNTRAAGRVHHIAVGDSAIEPLLQWSCLGRRDQDPLRWEGIKTLRHFLRSSAGLLAMTRLPEFASPRNVGLAALALQILIPSYTPPPPSCLSLGSSITRSTASRNLVQRLLGDAAGFAQFSSTVGSAIFTSSAGACLQLRHECYSWSLANIRIRPHGFVPCLSPGSVERSLFWDLCLKISSLSL